MICLQKTTFASELVKFAVRRFLDKSLKQEIAGKNALQEYIEKDRYF